MILAVIVYLPSLIWAAQHDPLQIGAIRSAPHIESNATQTQALNRARSNWTSPDASCAKYNDLRNFSLGDIGVRIDAAEPWADGFRRALSFWNSVLAANFHEETNLDVCAVRIVDGRPDILEAGIVARSQLPYWTGFSGKIAVSSASANEMSSAEIYAAAVHELGHTLGLRHNGNVHSVMYFLDVEGGEMLDSNDLSNLRGLHELRQTMASKKFLSIQAIRQESTAGVAARRSAGSGLSLGNGPRWYGRRVGVHPRPRSTVSEMRSSPTLLSGVDVLSPLQVQISPRRNIVCCLQQSAQLTVVCHDASHRDRAAILGSASAVKEAN